VSARLSDLELFRRLVSIDSTSANSNLPIADFICNYLDRPDVETFRVPAPDQDKVNLVFWLGPRDRDAARGLMLSGHMDTVPVEQSGWESDPFSLAERNGSYFARGSSDMKGFLALAMNAAAALDSASLRSPLVLLFTYDEEMGTLGAHDFVRSWRERSLPRNVIIGEPTSLRVVSAHKGHLKLRIKVLGKSAHSGYPHLGRNAIERAGGVVSALTKMRLRLAGERPPHSERFPQTPYATLNIGTIRGGVAVNVIPDRCELEVGIRLLPGMKSEEIVEELRDMVGRALAPAEYELDVVSDSPPMLLSDDALIYRSLCELVGQRSVESVSFASDAGWLQRLGLQCVLMGPGSIEVAHRPNEFMPADEFGRAAGLLPTIVKRFCIS
jgi:acetylornithine deacetylase